MLNHHHKQMVNHLRLNSRKSIKNISIDMKISSQKARRIKRLVDNSIIQRYTILIDFNKMPEIIRTFFILNPKITDLRRTRMFLESSDSINSLHGIDDFGAFFFEAIFYDASELNSFLEHLKNFSFNKKECMYISEDLKRESFLLP